MIATIAERKCRFIDLSQKWSNLSEFSRKFILNVEWESKDSIDTTMWQVGSRLNYKKLTPGMPATFIAVRGDPDGFLQRRREMSGVWVREGKLVST